MKTNYKKKFSKLFIISVLITSFLISSSENTNAGAWVSNGYLYSYNHQSVHSARVRMNDVGQLFTYGCERETVRSNRSGSGLYWNLRFTSYGEKCSSIMY